MRLDCRPISKNRRPDPDRTRRMSDDGEQWFQAAIERHRAGDLQAAEPLYRRAIEAAPAHAAARSLHGACLLQLGRFDESIARLAALVAEHPAAFDAWNNLGVAYRAAGRAEDAERALRTALRVNPEYADAAGNLAS